VPESGRSIDPIGTLLQQQPIAVRAILLGERLDTRGLEQQDTLGRAPLVLRVREGGVAVLFRYGVIALFNVSGDSERSLLGRLGLMITDPFEPREADEIKIVIQPETDDQIDLDGTIRLKEATTERIQIVADALAKSLILSHYETRAANAFDRVEPMAQMLRRRGHLAIGGRPLLRQIGNALLVQQNLVGRAATSEKPDLLWDHPELERLYTRLAEEYELRERDRALDRKQDVILRTTETLLGLVQQRASTRLEWYVVALIVAELVVAIYALV